MHRYVHRVLYHRLTNTALMSSCTHGSRSLRTKTCLRHIDKSTAVSMPHTPIHMYVHVSTRPQPFRNRLWIDMLMDICVDLCTHQCSGMGTFVCKDMCIDMHIDVCIEMCIDMRRIYEWTCVSTYVSTRVQTRAQTCRLTCTSSWTGSSVKTRVWTCASLRPYLYRQ